MIRYMRREILLNVHTRNVDNHLFTLRLRM